MSVRFEPYPPGVGRALPGGQARVRHPDHPPREPGEPRPRYSRDTYTRTVQPLMGLMVAVARRILGDDAQAWDAVQEALIGLWNEGEVPPNPRAWLTRAVALRSLHLARSRARRRRHELRACAGRPESAGRDEPSRRLEYEELTRVVDRTLGSIPPDCRDVVLLRTTARMDYAAIAAALGIPIGTVRSRLNRARRRFRDAFSQSFPAGDGPGTSTGDRLRPSRPFIAIIEE